MRTVTITDRGRPVAQMTPIWLSPMQRLIASGRERPARHAIADLPPPEPGPDLSGKLARIRQTEQR